VVLCATSHRAPGGREDEPPARLRRPDMIAEAPLAATLMARGIGI
jgi:hypothetical protein